jgi:hypothetical protein
MEIQPLGKTALEDIHQAFSRAFSDYEVPFELPFEKFAEMLRSRDVNLDFSIGCFEKGELIGFILCGYRKIGGLKCCYDSGTGIVKENRQRAN